MSGREPGVAHGIVVVGPGAVVGVPQEGGLRGEDVAVVRVGPGRPVEVAGGALLVAVHLPHQPGVLRQQLAVVGVRQDRAGVVLLRPPPIPFHLVEELRVVPEEEAVAGVLVDEPLVVDLDAGAVPSPAAGGHQVAAPGAAVDAAPAVRGQQARAQPVDPEAPCQEQRVLLRARAARAEAERPKARLLVIVVGVLILLLLVSGPVARRERLDRLERRPGPRRQVVVVVVVRAAAQRGEVAVRARAAQAAPASAGADRKSVV